MRFATLFSFSVNAYVAFAYWVLAPLHSAGIAQPVMSFLNGLGHVLSVPGLATALLLQGKVEHSTAPTPRIPALVANFVIYFLALSLLAAGRKGRAAPQPATGSLVPPGLSRRKFLGTGAKLLASGATASLGYTLLLEPRWVSVTRRAFPIRGLPPTLDGLRVAQLTDIHLGPWISLGYVRDVIRKTNELEPDLILLTGDYVHQSPKYIDPAVSALAGLRARIGIVGVLGNHDWWEGVRLTRRAFDRTGIPLIDNARIFLSPERALVKQSSEGLCIAGVGDLLEDRCLYKDALGGVPEAMPRLLLSHNPDVAEERGLVEGGFRVDLMLSGHTHGGQIWIPGLGTPVVPSRFGQKYARGLVQGPVCPVFTSSGIGMTVLPLRLGVPPEIAVIELKRAEA